jgi:predicted DsbA family dithiol-disulfide isomerase
VRVDVWLDLVCPWCYIGARRLDRAVAELGEEVEVVLHSFELDPAAPAEGGAPTLGHLATKYGMSPEQARAAQLRVSDVARTDGLEYRLDETHHLNSFDAHRLLHAAREQGLQLELAERLMRAYFTEAQDIADRAVLARLAGEAGVDAADVLAGDAYADAVRADERQAAGYGIHGVPFFVLADRYAIEGAQPAELLLQGLQQALTTL